MELLLTLVLHGSTGGGFTVPAVAAPPPPQASASAVAPATCQPRARAVVSLKRSVVGRIPLAHVGRIRANLEGSYAIGRPRKRSRPALPFERAEKPWRS